MDSIKLLKPHLYSETSDGGRLSAPVLQGGRCSCGYVFFPMQTYGCERCGSHGNALTPQPLSPRGTLLASAVVHLHADKDRLTPFTIVKVALDDGPVVRTLLADDCGEVAPGQRLEAKLVPLRRDDGEAVLDLRFTTVG
jgi:uncharacterized protein